MLYETHFLVSLGETWLVEIPLLLLLVRYILKKDDLSPGRTAGAGLLASAVTLPYLWFVLPAYLDARYYPLIGESLVIAGEAVIFFHLLRVRPADAVFLSLVVNAASFVLGMWLG